MTLTEAVAALRSLGRPQRLTENARVGIPNDSALRELRGEAVQARLQVRESAAGAGGIHARATSPASARAT